MIMLKYFTWILTEELNIQFRLRFIMNSSRSLCVIKITGQHSTQSYRALLKSVVKYDIKAFYDGSTIHLISSHFMRSIPANDRALASIGDRDLPKASNLLCLSTVPNSICII